MDRSAAPAAPRVPLRPRAAASGTLASSSPEQTKAIGRALGAAAEPATLIALIGPLGAGKTVVAKGIADGLGVTSVVNSPTFVLMNEHRGRLPLYHVDAYRLDDPEEALAAGLLDERQAGGVTVVEWADRLGDWLPDERLEIELIPEGAGNDRRLRWEASGSIHERLAAALAAPPGATGPEPEADA
jgi:tRNA threonylcarbamoyladenosine biosynthesis protein TsaE